MPFASSGELQPSTTGRQKLACEECRKRKLRCDGQQPQCGVCKETGIICQINPSRLARGPKKGLLKSLRIQTAELRHRLQERESSIIIHGDNDIQENRGSAIELITNWSPNTDSSIGQPVGTRPKLSPVEGLSQQSETLPDLTQIDLTQIYFERVHPFTPFIQRQKYFSWARQPNLKTSQYCLQFAMWALAASLSAQYRQSGDSFYQSARAQLEYIETCGCETGSLDIEHAQAWILVAFYELTRTPYQRAWMRIGRTCRLIQLMGLHRIDCANSLSGDTEGCGSNSSEAEEQRRTFWMAYCLDRLVSMRNNCPLAFNELVICTRLPTSEGHFQEGEIALGSFLSQEIASESMQNAAPFTALIICATIGGRCLSHQQQAVVEVTYGGDSLNFWDRHQWLHLLLTQKLRTMARIQSLPSLITDPMYIFTRMVAHTTLLYLCKIPTTLPEQSIDTEQGIRPSYEEEAKAAAVEIFRLADFIDEISIFKVHPLTPYALFSAAMFLM